MTESLEESVERTARIFNLQKYNMYDGPGIRSIAFFKGAPCVASGALIPRASAAALRLCSSELPA